MKATGTAEMPEIVPRTMPSTPVSVGTTVYWPRLWNSTRTFSVKICSTVWYGVVLPNIGTPMMRM